MCNSTHAKCASSILFMPSSDFERSKGKKRASQTDCDYVSRQQTLRLWRHCRKQQSANLSRSHHESQGNDEERSMSTTRNLLVPAPAIFKATVRTCPISCG